MNNFEEISRSCALNSTTLAALVEILISKNLISREDLQEAFDKVRKKASEVTD